VLRRDALIDGRHVQGVIGVGNGGTGVDGFVVQVLDADAAAGECLPGAVEAVAFLEFIDAGMPEVIAALVQ
jgi:hypothetical protein